MDKILDVVPLSAPKFIHPITINYIQDGVQKTWEAILSHDSVSILIYHEQRDAFVLVKQLRATVLNANKTDGMMYELCAGIVDKKLPNKVIAQEEILEECGYDVPLDTIQKVSSFYTSVGTSGAQQTLYYCKVNESMKVTDGGGLEDESIEVIYLPLKDVKSFMFDERYQKTPGMLMSFYWFFDAISHKRMEDF